MLSRVDGKPYTAWATSRWFAVALLAPLPFWLGLWLLVHSGWVKFAVLHPEDAWGWMILLLGSPMIEEWLFRSQLQKWLLTSQWPSAWCVLPQSWGCISTANVLTSMIFAALHGLLHQNVLMVGTLLPSLILGWCYERAQQRLMPCIVVHIYYNAGLQTLGIWL